MTEQEKEIKTIKERTLKVKLSDADCERILEKCGRHGLTVGELFENFIGDLVGGTYTNGSDEGMYADQYFDRCWFGMFPEETLLKHLLDWGTDPEEYLELLDNIETAEKEKEYAKEHPEEIDEEEVSFLDDDLADWQEELKDMLSDWKPEKEPNIEEEIATIKKWLAERTELKGEEDEQN